MTTRESQPVTKPESPSPAGTSRLAISLVTWEAADLTIECLRSIESELHTVPGLHVYLVDNDSRDGSADRIRDAITENGWDGWITFITAPGNHGFGAGNNIAFREILAQSDAVEYVLMLNPDTVVRPDAFRILIDFMDQHPEAGIAGGRSEDPDTTPQLCCFHFPNALSEFALYTRFGIVDRVLRRFLTRVPLSEEPHEIGWVSGALMIIRRQILEEIGLMDEGYFLYYEETDFTLRAKRAGWTCWHVPQSRVVHYVGHSSGVTLRTDRPARRPRFWFESRHRFFIKHYGFLYTVLTDALAILAFSSWRLRRILQRKPDTDPPHFLRDFVRHSVFFRGRRLNTPEQARPSSFS